MPDDEPEQQPATQAERKSQQRAVRAELARRRAHGIRRRHANRLAHWAANPMPAELAALVAKIAARQPDGVDARGGLTNDGNP